MIEFVRIPSKFILWAFCTILFSCASGSRPRYSKEVGEKSPRAKILRQVLSEKQDPKYIAVSAGTDSPEALCKDFRLRAKDIRHFFFHADEQAPTRKPDSDPADIFACYVKGVLKSGADRYQWQINHDGTGHLDLSSKTRVHLRCPHCPALYSGH